LTPPIFFSPLSWILFLTPPIFFFTFSSILNSRIDSFHLSWILLSLRIRMSHSNLLLYSLFHPIFKYFTHPASNSYLPYSGHQKYIPLLKKSMYFLGKISLDLGMLESSSFFVWKILATKIAR
jgi:hypothetical protein